MCVRFVQRFDGYEAVAWMRPAAPVETELFPGEIGRFATPEDGLREGRWGLQPAWARDPLFGKKNAYNARSETVTEKPTFRTAFARRRCVVPASAFYERAEGRWLRMLPTDAAPFLLAGLWEPVVEGEDLPTFTLLTTTPNATIADVHDRMPVLLRPDDLPSWTSPDAAPADLLALLLPAPPDVLRVEDAGPVQKPKTPRLL